MNGHVALLLPDLRMGGAQRVFLTLARAFLRKGMRVDIVVGLAEGELLSEVPFGTRLLPLCTRPPVFGHIGLAAVMLLRLTRYLLQHRPDTLFSTLTGTNLVAATARRIARVPTRVILREASSLTNLRHSLYIILMRRIYQWADIIVALTPEMQAELERVLGLPSDCIVQIPNPVDIERLRCDANVSLPVGFDIAQRYVLAVGRLSPPKDFLTLIRAFSHVIRVVPVKLVILGEGPDRLKIEAQIRELSLEEQVELRGFDANPYRWMARAAVFVLSSCWEGCPNVIVEAQTFGIPVAVTEYDSSVFSLLHQPSCVVPIGDEIALARAILTLLEVGCWRNGSLDITSHNVQESVVLLPDLENISINKYFTLLNRDY